MEDNFPADVVLAHTESGGLELLKSIRHTTRFGNIPFILMVDRLSDEAIKNAKINRADDIFSVKFNDGDLLTRIRYFKKGNGIRPAKPPKK